MWKILSSVKLVLLKKAVLIPKKKVATLIRILNTRIWHFLAVGKKHSR